MMASVQPRGSILMLTQDRDIDRRILLESDELREDGWTVTIVAMPSDDETCSDPSNVMRVRQRPRGASRARAVMRGYKMCRRVFPMNSAPMRWLKAVAWSAIANPETFYLRLFKESIEGMRPDIVIAHDVPMLPVGEWVARKVGARLVFDSHELWCEQRFPKIWRSAWRRVEAAHIGSCDAVITVNQSIADELERRYGVAKVHVISNATIESATVPTAGSHSLRDVCGILDTHRILLYQGNLTEGRQLEECVRAMARVRDKTIHLVFMGSGSLRGRLERRVTQLLLASHVHFVDAVPQLQLVAWTMSADAGIIPYVETCLNNRLCTPNKLYEFIAAGLPILASDLPELRIMVHDNSFGIVAQMSGPEQIARAIDAFFSDPIQLAGWRKSVSQGRSRYRWDIQAEHLRSIIRDVAASARTNEIAR